MKFTIERENWTKTETLLNSERDSLNNELNNQRQMLSDMQNKLLQLSAEKDKIDQYRNEAEMWKTRYNDQERGHNMILEQTRKDLENRINMFSKENDNLKRDLIQKNQELANL